MKRGKGFTVIELVVAVTIVCLLVAVAVASFQDHMTHKARAQARKALVETAEWLQQQHATSGTYLVTLPVTQSPSGSDAIYQIKLATVIINASDPKTAFPATSTNAYTVQAVPVDSDSCGTFLLDSAGRVGVTGATAHAADCWR
jgi:type IV pilus assembly protein PilE